MHKFRQKFIFISSAHSQKNEIEKCSFITLHKCTYIHTYKPKPICPDFFKVGGIKSDQIGSHSRKGDQIGSNSKKVTKLAATAEKVTKLAATAEKVTKLAARAEKVTKLAATAEKVIKLAATAKK